MDIEEEVELVKSPHGVSTVISSDNKVEIPIIISDVVKNGESGHIFGEGEGEFSEPGEGGSEIATGSRTGLSTGREGDDQLDTDVLSEGSDAGWDTDLDIEEEKEEYDVTGQRTYARACEMIGVIPVSHFIRCLQSREATIDLSHHYIGPKGAKAIAVPLTSNTSVTHLNLSNNGLSKEGGLAIADMLKENCYITHLDLSNNSIGATGAYAIADMLNSNSTVTHCNFSGSVFDDKAAEPVSEIIKVSLRITYLDLSHNEFSEVSGTILGAAIAESEVLQTLNLSWNHIRRKGAIAIAQGLKSNQMLKVLNLAYNGFGTEGAIALADALKVNTTLQELDITDNRILIEGVKAIAKVLPTCENLKTLKIGQNPIGMAGVTTLLDALKTGSSSLTELCMDGITVTLEIAKIIKDMTEDISSLTITHAGTGGYKEPKPLPTPIQKLTKYSKENNVKLNDLFLVFDKKKHGYLTEEEFRASLKHISAPLMEFEVLKLLKEFGKEREKVPTTEEGEEEIAEEDEGPVTIIDYNAILESAKNC